MIVLIRCNDIISDSRTKKYLDFLVRKQADYKIIAWDRLGNSEKLPNTMYCPSKSKYNQGGVAAIIDRLKWMWFILKSLFSLHADLRIHACDLDAAFPAVIYKLLSSHKNYVLFDIYDWISDTLYNQGKIVSMAFAFMERISTRYADHIIICEPERIKQVPYDIQGRYSVLQNVPSFASSDFLYKDDRYLFDNDLFTLTYVGGFTEDRCIMELIDGAITGAYNLNIAGYGDASITSKLEANKDCPYIKYYGKVPYTDGLRIMYNSDIIYAMYSKKNPNHLFAAPNKYYEAMFVGKAIITTNGIIVATKVKENNIGYGIDESVQSLVDLVKSLSKDDVKAKSEISTRLWEKYKTITEDYLNTTYSEFMQLL